MIWQMSKFPLLEKAYNNKIIRTMHKVVHFYFV